MATSGGKYPGQIGANSQPAPGVSAVPVSALMAVDVPGDSWHPVQGVGSVGDGATGFESAAVGMSAFVGNGWDRQRTPNVFKTAQANTAASTAIWTPTSGKKFRLMGFFVDLPDNASVAVAAQQTLIFDDGGTSILIAGAPFVPAVAGTVIGAYQFGPISLGNGYLSIAANRVLGFSTGSNLVTGLAQVSVWGTEE